VLEFERNFISIKWTQTASFVAALGSFTTPAWQKRVDLDYCPLRKIFVKYMNNLPEGTYLVKFLVDGHFKCDPTLPMAQDETGNLNNVLEIIFEASEMTSIRRSGEHSGSITSSLKRGL